ncbi:MAG: neutral/alkaline non-lysosomal ceramidase N-terminal domain-containing protein, partial [Gemmatimonadales bacterium]
SPEGKLRAGIGRADITPPPGVGLMGYGPEGKRAVGWRQRLYARVILLEDASGERYALVAADLTQVSLMLHRAVAESVAEETGLGADRILLAATHAHTGPGHYFEARAYNANGSSVDGFDPGVVQFLAERIARAVRDAAAGLTQARAGWGEIAVWDITRNRSLQSFERNPVDWRTRFPRPVDVPGEGHVDSTFAMLRVDLLDPTSGEFRPAGAFSVFAIHGTGNAMSNDLLDGDIHAFAERRLERHVDSLNGRAPGFAPAAVHLVMNGAEGDVIPDITLAAKCHIPSLARVRRPGGPRSPPGPELWIPPDATAEAECIRRERDEVEFLGDRLGETAVELFDTLGDSLDSDLPIRRAFRTVRLTGGPEALCAPAVGTSTVAGSGEGGPTRTRNWRLFGFIDVGFEEGGSAIVEPEGCQGEKRLLLGGFRKVLYRNYPLPETVQLGVVRLGGVTLGAIPFEATTVAGGRIREAMAREAGAGAGRTLLVGLANGYNQYVATREEYAGQAYEGGSTLYGPGTAGRLAELMGQLASELPTDGSPSPPVEVVTVEGKPGPDKRVMPRREAGPAPETIERRVTAVVEDGELVVRWNDTHPGRLVPADGPVLRFDARVGDQRQTLAWDDDPRVEVRARGSAGRSGYHWEARWSPDALPEGPVCVTLLPRPGLPEVAVEVRATPTPDPARPACR